MFKDYYHLLGVSSKAPKQEIKQAYRSKSLKWHPDRNYGIDVTEIMQDINEAYKILSNDISRSRYDREYEKFILQRELSKFKQENTKYNSWNYAYEVHDEKLKNDINEARQFAEDIVVEFFKNLKATSAVAAKGAWNGVYGYIISSIIITIIFAIVRTCN
jgi:curved DNA-binding protein CbpA